MAAGSRLFVIGGFGTRTVEEYVLASNSWTARPNVPGSGGIHDHAASVLSIQREIVVARGWSGSGSTDATFLYDLASNTWSTGPNQHITRRAHSSEVYTTGRNSVVVLVAGGYTTGDAIASNCEYFSP